MNVRKTVSVVVVLSVLLGGLSAHAATALPYAQSFEGGYPADAHLTDTASGIVAASAAAALTGAGTQGLIVSNDTVTLDINNAAYDNAWIQVYMRPVKGATDPDVSGQTGAFYINSTGQLRARNGGVWENVGADGAFLADQYYGFIVHADYGTDTYDIYSNNGTFKGNMTRLNGAPLAFISAAATIDNVSVQSGERAFIDALAVSRAFQSAGQSTRVAVYHHQSSNTAEREFQLPAYSFDYTSPASARTIGGRLGNDILSGLVDGDLILLWTTNTFGFAGYEVDGGAFNHILYQGGQSLHEPVYTMSRVLIDQNNSRSDSFGFYPYTHTTVLALEGDIQSSAAGSSEIIYLNGTDQHPQGWTGLSFNESMPVGDLPFNAPANFSVNDDLYVSLPSAPNNWSWYRWNGSQWVKRTGPITGSIPPGANMWVKRQSADMAVVEVNY